MASSTLSSSISATLTAVASATSSSSTTKTIVLPAKLKIVGIVLAIASGLLIGSSFVFKKKGLLKSQEGQQAGEGVAYLKSPLWWLGMSMMILGEICNFGAYAFVEALVVTPLGALSVVVCAILSSLFLKETLTFFGWLGCALCILGSVVIALNGPKEESIGQIKEFQKLFLAPGFLAYIGVLFAASGSIIFYFAPKYGKKNMFCYILVCSMIGGISVSVTTGLGSAIVQTAYGDNQFKYWFMYFLLVFVIATLLTEVYYLNMALALFNTAMVTPTYYVIFTFFSMLTTIVLFQGLKATASQIITIVMGFLVICVGITILQMSKVDPVHLSKLDRRSTILLQAARSNTETFDEKGITGMEDPGMDALRGSFGTMGSIIRARSARRMSQSSGNGPANSRRSRPPGAAPAGIPHFPSSSLYDDPEAGAGPWVQQPHLFTTSPGEELLPGMKRHQLYDAPVPRPPKSPSSVASTSLPLTPIRNATIKFDSLDVVHQYHPTGSGDDTATHMQRHVTGGAPYPPVPAVPTQHQKLNASTTDGSGNSIRPPMSSRPSSHDSHNTNSDASTARPGIAQPQPRAVPGRADSRRLFESPAGGSDSLLSFPSVTDSAMSGGRDSEVMMFSDDDDNDKADTASARKKKTPKYPRGSGGDDDEESVSLWQRGDRDDSLDLDESRTGIRLVKPSNASRF